MISEITNEDCMEMMKRFPDKFFDFCLTDPPYGVNLKYESYEDSLENWYNLMQKFIPEVKRVCKMVIMPSCSINKLKWIYDNYPPDWIICWYKGSPGHASYIGFNDWEPLLVYGKLKDHWFHDHFTLVNNIKMGSFNHPCPKPIEWFNYWYCKLKNKDFKIFDPFLGSGSSRIAAKKNNFNFWGCELSKEYYEDQEKRFSEYFKYQIKTDNNDFF